MSPLTTIACIVGAAVLGFWFGMGFLDWWTRAECAAAKRRLQRLADDVAAEREAINEERGKFWMSSEVIRIRARFLQEAIEEWES